MKRENTSSRLKQIMVERNLRQVDILKLTEPYCQKYNVKMNKSDISQYCSGKTEPNQDKLFVLGKALQVNEAWLMGFDVPEANFDSRNNFSDSEILYIANMLTTIKGTNEYIATIEIIKKLELLNLNGLQKVFDYIMDLIQSGNYSAGTELKNFGKLKYSHQMQEKQFMLNAAHERTDIDIPEGTDTSDNDIMDDENF